MHARPVGKLYISGTTGIVHTPRYGLSLCFKERRPNLARIVLYLGFIGSKGNADMKTLFKALLAVCAISLTTGVNAGVIVGDKEWRQVTETVNFSWNDFSSVCNTSDGSCSGSLTNGTLGTVSFDGWTWASWTDVAGLFQVLPGWDGPSSGTSPFYHYSVDTT